MDGAARAGRAARGDAASARAVRGRAARADRLREAWRGLNVVLRHPRRRRAPTRSAPTATRGATTPEIDRIAAEGVVFERVYTPAVYTLGAMSSVWTSQYPDRHHSEVSFSARLPKDRLTLAELLAARGIHTAGFVANAVDEWESSAFSAPASRHSKN